MTVLSSAPTLPGGAQARSVTYLPWVAWRPTDVVEPTGTEDKARIFFDLMARHPQQGREDMVWDDLLAEVAAARCEDQAQDRWTGHVDPDGNGPNYWVGIFGYALPDWYGQNASANNIESLSHGGDGSVMQTWEGLLHSAPHAVHVLGLDPFFAEQTHVGVGYYYLESSEYKHYWCILSAPPEE